jgi:hypothetical protein
MNFSAHISNSLVTSFWVKKKLNSLSIQCCRSGSGIWDGKSRSGIRDGKIQIRDPG